MISMEYELTNITAHPFENPHVTRLIDRVISYWNYHNKELTIRIVDPFCNNKTTRRQGSTHTTNDLNPKFNADYCMEFNDFGEHMLELNKEFDLVLFDPPYSLRQLKEQYEGIGKDLELWQTHNMWKRGKDALAKCVSIGGYVISFGWNTKGFGKKRGFEKTHILVLEQAASEDRYNLLITVEKKVQTNLEGFLQE